MNSTEPSPPPPDTAAAPVPAECCTRAEARRTQILDAAAACFRTHGFHGASIAHISRLAGMSAGHIYHYFENKEAIIAAIVQRDLEHMLTMTARLRAASDVGEAMIACVAQVASDQMGHDMARLRLEIVAEAARNPEVARIVRAADCCCMASINETYRIARRGKNDDDAMFTAMTEVIAAMFEGLAVRAIRNPELDHQQVAIMFQRVIRQIIISPDWGAA